MHGGGWKQPLGEIKALRRARGYFGGPEVPHMSQVRRCKEAGGVDGGKGEDMGSPLAVCWAGGLDGDHLMLNTRSRNKQSLVRNTTGVSTVW